MSQVKGSSFIPCATCKNNPETANRLKQLEDEVRMLRDKATAAADKLADYEEELQALKGHRTDSLVDGQSGSPSRLMASVRPNLTRVMTAPAQEPQLSRNPSLGGFSFLGARKALPLPPSNKGDVAELEAALAREIHLREEAEKKVTTVESEIEELSATLFEQANEMVSVERKAKAQLEDKIGMLEQKDEDRRKRLDRIDAAMKRLERAKTLLSP